MLRAPIADPLQSLFAAKITAGMLP